MRYYIKLLFITSVLVSITWALVIKINSTPEAKLHNYVSESVSNFKEDEWDENVSDSGSTRIYYNRKYGFSIGFRTNRHGYHEGVSSLLVDSRFARDVGRKLRDRFEESKQRKSLEIFETKLKLEKQ